MKYAPEILVERNRLEAKYGQVWDYEELRKSFKVERFIVPFVFVRDNKTGKSGSLQFQHSPRFYFNFIED